MKCNPPWLQTFRPGTGTSRAPRGARTAQSPPRLEKGKCGARRRVGNFAQGQAAIRQPPKPGSGASHLLPSKLGRKFLLPSRGRPPGPGWETGGGGSRSRFSPLAEPWAAGVASSPPRRGSRGRTRGQTRCDWPAAAGGRSQAGRYLVGRLKRAQDIAERTGSLASAQPSPRRQAGSWKFWFALAPSLLPTTGSYMPLCPPTSTPCPHAPAPATGKGCCVFSTLLPSCLAACVSLGVDSGCRSQLYSAPLLQRCPAVMLQ